MKMTRIIAMKANLSIPDRVNRAQPIFAIVSWNFQVFELGWWIPIDRNDRGSINLIGGD